MGQGHRAHMKDNGVEIDPRDIIDAIRREEHLRELEYLRRLRRILSGWHKIEQINHGRNWEDGAMLRIRPEPPLVRRRGPRNLPIKLK